VSQIRRLAQAVKVRVPPQRARGVAQEELLLRAEDAVRLRACVAELCEIQRSVVTLRLLEERPGEDVAEALGITKNHAAVLLHRAKASLRECMTEASEL
jgi:RNA polymerase sigma-70 factor (ECF subfamily)